MAYKHVHASFADTTSTGAERCVLLVLCHHADATTGIAWPSQRTLAREANTSERYVRMALVALEDRGIIQRVGSRRRAVAWRVPGSVVPDPRFRNHGSGSTDPDRCFTGSGSTDPEDPDLYFPHEVHEDQEDARGREVAARRDAAATRGRANGRETTLRPWRVGDTLTQEQAEGTLAVVTEKLEDGTHRVTRVLNDRELRPA